MSSIDESFAPLFCLSIETPPKQVWRTGITLLNKLENFSKQSIMAPQQEQQEYLSRFLMLINRLRFDNLHGGLLMPSQPNEICEENQLSDVRWTKPVLANLYLAELLLLADRFFLNGELNYAALKIIKHFSQQLDSANTGLIDSQQNYQTSNLPCYFSEEKLEKTLSTQERTLLLSLVGEKNIIGEKKEGCLSGILYCQSCNLKQAAHLINMPFKQAQIDEHSIQTKLNQPISFNHTNQLCFDTKLDANSQMLCLLSKSYFYSGDPKTKEIATRLFSSLIKTIDQSGSDGYSLISLVLAGFHYLQVSFNRDILSQLLELVERAGPLMSSKDKTDRPHSKEINGEKLRFEKHAIISIITAFVNKGLIGSEIMNAIPEINHIDSPVWQIKWLEHGQVDLDSQQVALRSVFAPFRLVYTI